MTNEEAAYFHEDDGSVSMLDQKAFEEDVNGLLALLTLTGMTGENDHLASERLAELAAATSPAYTRKVALAVMRDLGELLLMAQPFLMFPVFHRRVDFFVMTYRRLRPDWEEQQFMGGGNG